MILTSPPKPTDLIISVSLGVEDKIKEMVYEPYRAITAEISQLV